MCIKNALFRRDVALIEPAICYHQIACTRRDSVSSSSSSRLRVISIKHKTKNASEFQINPKENPKDVQRMPQKRPKQSECLLAMSE